jgi:predicted outer membrane repeat protein
MFPSNRARVRTLAAGGLLLLAGAPVAAATFRVGNDGIPPCTHTTLAAAVAAAAANGPGSDSIYVEGNVTISSTLDLNNHSVEIVGGFPDCIAAAPGPGRSTATMTANPGFWIHGGTSSRTVTIAGFQIIRSGAGGRLIDAQGPALVWIENAFLSNGAAVDGANVRMAGDVILYLGADASVYGGDATGDGGGIHCSGGGTILATAGSRIGDNTAAFDGGGVYMDDCLMNLFAGTPGTVICPVGGEGVVCNRAESSGGGIYAINGSQVNLIGGALDPAVVAENVSDQGGGIYATGAAVDVEASNAWITDNIGAFEGGGVYVRDGASFSLVSTEPDCRGMLCSQISRNNSNITGGIGAGVAADSGADVVIRQTYMTGNTANVTGSVIFAEDAGTTVALEGLVVRANSGSLNDAYFETDDGAVLTMAFSTVDEGMGCCKGLFDTNNGSTVNLYDSILIAISDATGQGRIFDEPIAAGETRFGDCLLHREHVSTLPPPVDGNAYETIVSPGTLFVNRAAGDLRLRRGSQAQDFCDTFRYTPATTDIDREPRGWDDPTVADSPFGPYDLGADEWRPLLIADHEEGDCSDWSSDTGGC